MRAAAAIALVGALLLGGGAASSSYLIRPGDTVSAIAARNGVTVSELARINHLVDPSRIIAGERLLLPAADAHPSPGGAAAFHVVQPGETLAGIAARYRTTTRALARANGIVDPSHLLTGARLAVVDPAAPAPSQPAAGPGGRGRWRCPVAGPVTFANDWGLPRAGGRFHEGNDLFARRGTPVVAPVAGTVHQITGTVGGRQVWIDGGDGFRYIGSHLDRFAAAGRVPAGTVVGYVGDSGDARGGPPHLHFEIHPGGGPAVNPYPTVLAGCRG